MRRGCTINKKILIGAVAAVLCAVAFYFGYWTKTPTYSIGLIREAVAQHDIAAFEKHVDLDTLYTKGVDELFIAYDEITGDHVLSNPFAAGFIQAMKPKLVQYFKTETIKKVKGIGANDPQNRQGGKLAEQLSDPLEKDVWAADNVSIISQDGSVAVVSVKLNHRQLKQPFELKVKMTELADGTWQVKEAVNLAEFVIAVDRAKKASANAPKQ